MSGIFDNIHRIDHDYSKSADDAWATGRCPDCGGTQMGVIAFLPGGGLSWLRCVGCGRGFVRERGVTLPGAQPFDVPQGLPETEAAVWAEIRSCLSAGAYTASAMLCRKLLFHIAVATGLPPKDKSNRAPTYAQCVNQLEAEGVITKRMRTWVDRIKDIGNDANHEITPVTERQALDVAGFTHQLLRLRYEMDVLVRPEGTDDDDDQSATLVV